VQLYRSIETSGLRGLVERVMTSDLRHTEHLSLFKATCFANKIIKLLSLLYWVLSKKLFNNKGFRAEKRDNINNFLRKIEPWLFKIFYFRDIWNLYLSHYQSVKSVNHIKLDKTKNLLYNLKMLNAIKRINYCCWKSVKRRYLKSKFELCTVCVQLI